MLTEAASIVWHVTDVDSANDIMANGFRALSQKQDGTPGLSVSINPRSAASLLRALQRMNSFDSYEDVVAWWTERGVQDAEATYQSHIKDLERRPEREHPGHLYLDFNQMDHPAVGGTADVPHDEFLWNDIARKLVGKDIVAVAAEYTGEVSQGLATSSDSIEAEKFVEDVQNLRPLEIVSAI
jgi:hypothetical protein